MKGRDDLLLAGAFFWIIALLVVPLPAFLLDFLLSLSLSVALLIMLVSLTTERPLDFSVFPSLLLIVTLFRLGLNVASTRLILVHGAEGSEAAGRVIQAFGDIAVGGNYLVGIILFLIFVIINFVVIAKGSGRIAEVAARFTLDAMPGKQMAIDADLNQGLLDDAEAKARRRELQRETDFYGAMDGASKFVKGDAIAGLVIMGVNLAGGLLVGIGQAGMPFSEAVSTYTILTVGDGLVGQIPALVISTAAGVVVTRAGAGEPLAQELRTQMIVQPRALAGVAGMLGSLALVPGVPFAPFAVLAAGAGVLSRVVPARAEEDEEHEAAPVPAEATEQDELRGALQLDEIELEIGYGLIPLVDAARGGELLARIRATRLQLASELGFLVPLVHIRDNLQLAPDEYAILVRGVRVASGQVPAGRSLALRPGPDAPDLPGIATRDAAFGIPAVWIQDRDREQAAAAGYAVVDPGSALATHLAEVIRTHASELLTRQQVRELVDAFAERAPKVVEEIVPAVVSLSVLHRTFRSLIEEGVSIRDVGTTLDTLAEYAPKIEDPDLLTDLVRERLGRSIVSRHLDGDGALQVLTLEPTLEDALRSSLQRNPGGSFLAVEPALLERLIRGLEERLPTLIPVGATTSPVLLVNQTIRSPLRQLIARVAPRLAVLSHNELPPDARIVAVGQLEAADAR